MSQVEMLAAAQREYGDDEIQPEVLKILEPGNEFLQEVVDHFGKTRKLPNKAQIACFYELKSSNVGRIVGKSDRTVGRPVAQAACLAKINSFAEICSKREFWLSRPFGRDEQVFALPHTL
jgi:hypothetical protein